jgi:hypothetical protein
MCYNGLIKNDENNLTRFHFFFVVTTASDIAQSWERRSTLLQEYPRLRKNKKYSTFF